MKNLILAALTLTILTTACENKKDDLAEITEVVEEPIIQQYGYILNDFNVIRDTIRPGDTFGDILFANGVPQEKIMEVATKFRDSFDVRKIRVGRPYVLLNSKDSLNRTQAFIYEANTVDYAVVDFRDTLSIYNSQKPVRYEEREASGVITSSLSATL